MKFQQFSPNQIRAMEWWNRTDLRRYDAVICDGSVRSGKTLSMTIGFFLWSMTCFENAHFALCGKTVGALRRNVLLHLPRWLEGIFTMEENRMQNRLDVFLGARRNTYFLFGGQDESSYMKIQGMTLCGVLFDETALMPRSFVEQAVARCSVEGSRFWFNCNPETPHHWFYQEWILRREQKNALYLHFTMDDNLSLTPKVRARYEKLYTGAFYERYVLGRWVAAEGLVYPMFRRSLHVAPVKDRPYSRYVLSCDYGTANPTSVGLWGYFDGIWYRVREYYFDSRREKFQRTDEEHYQQIIRLLGEVRPEFMVVDPSAASFLECVRRHAKLRVRKADNRVIDGVRLTGDWLRAGKLRINECCADCIRELETYRWDESAAEDRVKKENDHAMDDTRYFVCSIDEEPTFSFA